MKLQRTHYTETITEDFEYRIDNLLEMNVYNYGQSDLTVFGVVIPAYTGSGSASSYVLSGGNIPYEDNLKIPIKFNGTTKSSNNALVVFSCLKTCK